ncbi:MAG: Fe-S oxidoreductase, partial [Flavobacteriaceae bacterium]
MVMLPQVLFLLALLTGLGFFVRNMKQLQKSIKSGRPLKRNDQPKKRWKMVFRLALGQSKMVTKPVAGILHIVIYLGFILINVELLEIILDGLLGTHRLFAPYLGASYAILLGSFEFLALGVLVTAILFWIRRNGMRLQRFWKPEMKGWPKKDADYILY